MLPTKANIKNFVYSDITASRSQRGEEELTIAETFHYGNVLNRIVHLGVTRPIKIITEYNDEAVVRDCGDCLATGNSRSCSYSVLIVLIHSRLTTHN